MADLRGRLFTMTPDGRFVHRGGEAVAGARLAPFAPSRFGPVTDDYLIRQGTWQYTHYYD